MPVKNTIQAKRVNALEYYKDGLPMHMHATSQSLPVGVILPYANASPPSGYLVCNGDALDISSYPELFSLVGYTYGGALTHFRLPDIRGRTIMGALSGAAPAPDRSTLPITLGQYYGNDVMTVAQMPKHAHTYAQVIGGSGGLVWVRMRKRSTPLLPTQALMNPTHLPSWLYNSS